ncbi:hypothetical protein C8J56DRAFT_1113329 [Mycena floridula]|nr:hypothetical protein C8J56DRAFT_1113329 [Mycena floridula]
MAQDLKRISDKLLSSYGNPRWDSTSLTVSSGKSSRSITCQTAVLSAASLITAAAFYHAHAHGDDNLIIFFIMLTGKLYTFAVLRMLNSRDRLHQRFSSQDLGRISLGDWHEKNTVGTMESTANPQFTNPLGKTS